jgi:hypothetical protein
VTEQSETSQDILSQAFPVLPAASSPAASRDDSLVDSLVRLGVGGVSLGARLARQPLALLDELGGRRSEDAEAPQAPPLSEQAMDAAIGAAVETGQLARRGARSILGLHRRVWRMTEPARRPLNALGVTAAVQAVAGRAEARVDALQAIGHSEVELSRQRVVGTLGGAIDGIIAYLADNPQVDALIGVQVDKLLPQLAEHPAVERLIAAQIEKILPKLAESEGIHDLIAAQVERLLPELAGSEAIHDLIAAQVERLLPELAESEGIHDLIAAQVAQILPTLAIDEQIELLIRAQGDKYIDYLNEHPDKVRNLVSGQSVGLAGQMLNEVRERTVTADSVAEMVVRNLLRKKPRSDVAEPIDAVQARAASRILPSDFVSQKDTADER